MKGKSLLVLEGDFGPRMKALPNDVWREFVRLYCAHGRKNAMRAYGLAAGIDINDPRKQNACAVSGSRLLHDERIQEAILECTQKALRTLAPLAVAVWEEVAQNPQAANSDRLKATELIANRTGLQAIAETKVTHVGGDTDTLKQIALLAGVLGLPVDRLLGKRLSQNRELIDVTPEPVEEDPWADVEY